MGKGSEEKWGRGKAGGGTKLGGTGADDLHN